MYLVPLATPMIRTDVRLSLLSQNARPAGALQKHGKDLLSEQDGEVMGFLLINEAQTFVDEAFKQRNPSEASINGNASDAASSSDRGTSSLGWAGWFARPAACASIASYRIIRHTYPAARPSSCTVL